MPPPLAPPMLTAMREMYGAQIEYINEVDPKSIDAGRKVLTTSKGDIPFQHANIILPMRAPGLIRKAGLGERFAGIELPTFQSRVDKTIFVVGDSQGAPLPKSGHIAFGAGQQVGAQILATIAGKYKEAGLGDEVTLPGAICWGKVSTSLAIMINVTSSIAVGDAPKIKYQVDPVANAGSSKGAMEWGRDMWNAMLG
jgi:NADPH-dependent 2,4-dienoyl-CoA reductase/sulfur reductase-like enzyme